MATCNAECSGFCTETCSGGCKRTCKGDCEGTCKGECERTCKGECEGTCKDECEGTCTKSCSDSCYTSCKDGCLADCKGKCKGYCASICQTYCEKAQTFTENLSPIPNAIGKPEFSWSNPVKGYNSKTNEQGSTIIITAKEWNILKGYIQTATKYCGGTAPSGANASDNPESPDNLISEAKYNDLANGLGLANVKANETLISADLINALSSTYNGRQIKDNLPIGKKPLITGGKDQCCQKGQTCMIKG